MTTSSDWYTRGWQNWATMMEQTQHNALAFQQAVATISALRTRAVAAWWQQAPQRMAQLAQSPSPHEALAAWYGATAEQALTLATDTMAQRNHLLGIWQRPYRNVNDCTLQNTQPCQTSTCQPATNATASAPVAAAKLPAVAMAEVPTPNTLSSPALPLPDNVVPMVSSTHDSFARTSSSSSVTGMRRGVASRLSRGRR